MNTAKSDQKKTKPRLPKKIAALLQKDVMDEADAKRAYASAAKTFERYRNQYEFSNNMEYKLGLLYDHRAMQLKRRNPRGAMRLYRKAEVIYQAIVARSPDFLFGYHGLARVYVETKRYDTAIRYELRAYRLLQKLPRREKGALGIGNIYLIKGDYKNAEKWFLREVKELGMNDVGAVANILMFYIKVKQYKKGLPYANQLEKILKRMGIIPRKSKEKKKNKTIALLLQRIRIAKTKGSR